MRLLYLVNVSTGAQDADLSPRAQDADFTSKWVKLLQQQSRARAPPARRMHTLFTFMHEVTISI